MANVSGKSRIWEIDFLRGIALVLMIYFHVIFDLREFYNLPVSYSSGINYFIGKTAAILFMLVSGVSCSISRSNLKRGARVMGAALVISLVTHLYDPGYGVKFGILHFLGTCLLLSPLILRLNPYVLICLGTIAIPLGNFFAGISTSNDFLFPVGITSGAFISSDYYPILPWIGIFLYGSALGKLLYKKKRSIFRFNISSNIISMIGRHTLIIYLIHQQIILFILWLIFR